MPPSDRNRAIRAGKAEGATVKAIAAEFKMTPKRVREIARRVKQYNLGAAILHLDPSSLEGLELTGKLPRLVWISLEASGVERLCGIDGSGGSLVAGNLRENGGLRRKHRLVGAVADARDGVWSVTVSTSGLA